MTRSAVPLHAWLILAAALVAVSSAGAVLQIIEGVPPILKASWRLQATSLLLLPFAVMQWKKMDNDSRKRFTEQRNLGILIGSGVCLFLHFGLWVWSLDHTTLTHSLLFVTAHPLVFVVGLALLGRPLKTRQSFGAVIGFIGVTFTLVGAGVDGDVTLIGDLAAFGGAIAIVGYLAAGRSLRTWMPLFVYAFPVTAIGAILLTIASIGLEGTAFSGMSADFSVFGWINPIWLPAVLYLAIGPGLVGHTGINAVLRWISPVVISVSVMIEPILGTIIGMVLGTATAPDPWTWFGGGLILLGIYAVTTTVESVVDNDAEE